ncbi:MAG: TolC family protein [Muribaculaceae bacterium]
MRLVLLVLAVVGLCVPSAAQTRLTLEECLKIGLSNNLMLKTAEGDVQKGKLTISENRAKLLPQINAVASFNDNFAPPVSVTDGTAYGKQYNVTKTLQYNAAAGLQLQMPLYNQMALTAVKVAKTVDRLNELSYEKAREDLIMQISNMYYMAQNTEEQLALVYDNIGRLKELRDITVAFYDNDMAIEVDVKRVNINLENMQVQYDNAQAMLVQQYNMLKYVMDYPVEQEIAVVVDGDTQVEIPEMRGLDVNLNELQLLQNQVVLAEQQKKLAKEEYLPSLALTGNVMYSAYTDKFKNWFHSGESNHWYGSNGIGISLRVPIFDGFARRTKVRKAQIDIDNARLSYENAYKSMQTQYLNAINDVQNNQRNYVKQKDNYLLADDVYKVTTDRYREGIASMTEVLQDEMQLSSAQNNYLTAHYNFKMSNLTLLKLTGQLNKLLGNN